MVVIGSRFLTLMAVIGSLAGSILMFVLGLREIYSAYVLALTRTPEPTEEGAPSAPSIISVIEGLDRFLIGIVLLYFAYGVYSLFIHPEQGEEELALPQWLRVKQVGQLKQVVAEMIVVVLFVLFLRTALQVFQNPNVVLSWNQLGTLVILPLCTFLLAGALRLVELHPKPPRQTRRTEKPPRLPESEPCDTKEDTGKRGT